MFSSRTATVDVSYDDRRWLALLAVREHFAKWVLLAVMRYQDACCVVDEVVEIQEVHLVFHKQRRQGFQGLGDPYLHWFGIVSPFAESHFPGTRFSVEERKVVVELPCASLGTENGYRRMVSVSRSIKVRQTHIVSVCS